MNTLRLKKPVSFSPKTYWREILAILMLLLAFVFFRSERRELAQIPAHLKQSNTSWLLAGVAVTFIYIIFQAGMYKQSFAAIGLKIKWTDSIILFLKRNFISIFLPAGGVSALAYSPSQIRNAGFTKTQVHQASGLFGFAGLLTVFMVGLPVIVIGFFRNIPFASAWMGLVVLLALIVVLVLAARSIRSKGWLFVFLDKRFPSFTPAIHELFNTNVHAGKFAGVIIYSLLVEGCGIVHLLIAMIALGSTASFATAAIAYIISVIMMVISPFLRGLGAVEFTMVYVLSRSGYHGSEALSITMLYRIFEFWLPLLAGLLAFAWKGRNLFLRIAPALLTFMLGIVNIVSAITPPLQYRMKLLREYLPLTAIHASNMMVLMVGLSLLVTSAFLFRGLRMAWTLAVVFSLVSLFGHLGKALDFEEATIAVITFAILIFTSSQYRIQGSNKWMKVGLRTAITSFVAVSIFAFTSFYFIDKRHFGVDFTWQQSLEQTFKMYLLIVDNSLHPVTRFGHEFTNLIRILGLLNWAFLIFCLVKPSIGKHTVHESERVKAAFLVNEFGDSAMDYFKLNKDKLYFFSGQREGFIAFRITRGYAVVLEGPVSAGENKLTILHEFDMHCRDKGLKPVFYRVDEDSIPMFVQLRKRRVFIGQEAILEVGKFSLEGREKKSLRNGINGLQKKGYVMQTHRAPQTAEFISQLKKISDEWLDDYDVDELVFSQGKFDEDELMNQDIITMEDANGTIKAFLNIIPDYAQNECTYDMIRKTSDAPGAAMDALILKLIEYAKENNQSYINLGLVPMMGITQPQNTPEQIIKLAAEKLKRFRHYQGLRDFKEKYASIWENKYLVYDNDFDLLQMPVAINKVMRP